MRSALFAGLLALLVAACADAGDADAGNVPLDTAAAAAPEPTEPDVPFGWMPPAAEGAPPAGAIGDANRAFQVVARLSEWAIDVSPDTIRAGDVTIALENQGERPHTIEVRNERAGRWRSLPIPPGGTVTLTMPMPPANFEIVSTTDAYVERGMRALLVVR